MVGLEEIRAKNYLYSEHPKSWALFSLRSLHKASHITSTTIVWVGCNNYNYYTCEGITMLKKK